MAEETNMMLGKGKRSFSSNTGKGDSSLVADLEYLRINTPSEVVIQMIAALGGKDWADWLEYHSIKRHLGALVARKAWNPSGTKSKWGLTLTSLRLPPHNDL